MKEFDAQTLSEYDGRDEKKPVLIARDGKVYDVTGSAHWRTGVHMNKHRAGRDLTTDLSAAPHGTEVFASFEEVGRLAGEAGPGGGQLPSWLQSLLQKVPFLKRHPHPMLVHYPIVFMFATVGFVLLALVTGHGAFETTALHCLAAGLIFTPLAIVSGLLTWWVNYEKRPMRQVRIKLWGSFLLMLAAAAAFVWRLAVPGILAAGGPGTAVYLLLVCSLALLVTVVGWYGAQLTFPLHK